MIFSLFRKNNPERDAAFRQYALLTDAGRRPDFYLQGNAPDTVIGRFEVISLLMILYFRRTAEIGGKAKDIAQYVADAFFEDLDHSMRELGVGDHGVPKRLKKLAQMFYGRVDSYGAALDAGDASTLEAALKRNLHPESTDTALSMRWLADYMIAAERDLKTAPAETVLRGEARIPSAAGDAV
ncbi:ubiquinol-cytochrome C chaperone family protein [Rhizobium sp. TRM95796]|uniref:ubiquinol-cytochrome C chaperone family protein n=1 Tax=Rhizobium sp. TRM95796 TaxID=2979862 RepID=UPI0021E70DC7|nr:ubiquinol-cytochrome C chaperone family protein [Rhizobium sp. TRM95796]MCV3765351.1 ubiquinol-cytochrome C chaperone [Rhizobium sp. TRM95796]